VGTVVLLFTQAMNLLTFEKWLEHWGEERLAQRIAESQRCGRSDWERRNEEVSLSSYPAWELALSSFWEENISEWHTRWVRCGGTLYEGRMIAAKWDGIWDRLSGTFADGLGNPYPPYARSSCASWLWIDQDEAIVMGVVSEAEFAARLAELPKGPSLWQDGKGPPMELLIETKRELEEAIYRHGGPRPGATREERVAHRRHQQREQAERAKAEYENRNQQIAQERAEKDTTFRLLEEVERSLSETPLVRDEGRWNWLCDSLAKLTTTQYFDRYPNWRARVWVASATMYGAIGVPTDELACLKRAFELNPQLPLKRRIKALDRQLLLHANTTNETTAEIKEQ
jgi:hypothetical protein